MSRENVIETLRRLLLNPALTKNEAAAILVAIQIAKTPLNAVLEDYVLARINSGNVDGINDATLKSQPELGDYVVQCVCDSEDVVNSIEAALADDTNVDDLIACAVRDYKEKADKEQQADINPRFVEFVDILDKAKEMWYLLRFLETFPNGCKDSVFEDVYSELTSENLASVRDCQKMLAEGLNNQVTNILAGKRGYVLAELEALLKNVKANLWMVGDENASVITDAILDAGESGDIKFYTQLGVGKYWNEVELPAEIGSLFDTFACSIENVGIVPSGKELEDGMAAISYYDLSDAIIVFESMDAAEAFAEANPIDPSDFLMLHDNAWCAV